MQNIHISEIPITLKQAAFTVQDSCTDVGESRADADTIVIIADTVAEQPGTAETVLELARLSEFLADRNAVLIW